MDVRASLSAPYMEWFNGLRINSRLHLISLILMISAFALGVTYTYGEHQKHVYMDKQVRSAEFAYLIQNIKIAYLKMQRAQQVLLLNNSSINTKRYIDAVLKVEMVFNRNEHVLNDASIKSYIKDLKAKIQIHNGIFDKISHLYVVNGLRENVGLQGELRTAIHQIEEQISKANLDSLTVKMLMMRRHEKDFIARKQEKYVALFGQQVEFFRTELRNSNLSLAYKDQLLKLLDTYTEKFHAFSIVSKTIDIKIGELNNIYDTMTPRFEALFEIASRSSQKIHKLAHISNQRTDNVLLGSGVLILLITISLVHFIGKSITTPIAKQTQAIKQLANGDTDIRIKHKNLNNEIGDMARAMQIFKNNASELKRALEAEKEMSAMQRQFVTMASHEFRTPLAIIDGTAQRMTKRIRNNLASPDDSLDRLDKIRNAVVRMTKLMESTLSVAKMEQGALVMNLLPCDVAALISEICERQQEISDAHRIHYDVNQLPKTIIADTGSIEQIFTNLLSNAVKYSPDAPDINVEAKVEGSDVVISVSDNGLGIDEEDLPHLFERFFRAKSSMGTAGTGIGLNLAYQLIKMHDGTFSVKSTLHEGSTFTVHLPISGPTQSIQSTRIAS